MFQSLGRVQQERQQDVLFNVQVLKQFEFLKHHAHRRDPKCTPSRIVKSRQFATFESNVANRRNHNPRDQVEQRRLAATAGADQCDGLARRNAKA